MKRQLITGALIVVIGVSTFFAQKQAMKIADIRADEIYSQTVAQAAKALPRTTVQIIVNTPEENKFLTGWVKQEFKDDTYTEKTVSGTLLVMHEHELSKDGSFIHKENEEIHELYLKTVKETYRVENISYSVIENLNGIEVSLTGLLSSKENQKGQKTFVVNMPEQKIKNLRPKTSKTVKNWTATKDRGSSCEGNYCSLIIPIDMSGNPSELPSSSEIHDYIFTNPGRIKNAFYEMSYGQMTYGGTVTDWITIPPEAEIMGNLHPEVEQYIFDNFIDLNNYDQITYLVNRPGHSMHNSGIANSGPEPHYLFLGVPPIQYSIIQNRVGFGPWNNRHNLTQSNNHLSSFDTLYIHETGHNLGARHDNFFQCKNGPTSLPSECIHQEYGNRYSIMGNPDLAGHFSSIQKLRIGWLNQNDIPFINTGSVQITPVELTTAKAVGIDFDSDLIPEYVLEKRVGTGIDTIMTKSKKYKEDTALVYRVDRNQFSVSGDVNSWISDYRLVDVTPAISQSGAWLSLQNATLDSVANNNLSLSFAMQTINDSQRGINLRAVKNTLGGIVSVQPITDFSGSCLHRPVMVFQQNYSSPNIFEEQLPDQSWAQSQAVDFFGDLSEVYADNTNPDEQIFISIDFYLFNNDSIWCSPSDFQAKLILDGNMLPDSVMVESFQPWSQNYFSTHTVLTASSLSYGPHVITLEVTKSNDGSVTSFDLPFEFAPI